MTQMTPRFISYLMASVVLFAPSLAAACPVCAGRETNTTMIATMLGIMIAVPYAIAVVVIRLVRKTDQESAWTHEPLANSEAKD